MLTLLADVVDESNHDLNPEGLAKALARTTPGRISRKAEQIRHDQGGSKRRAFREAFKILAKL
jgi:hypothetical protein